jgi:hypothetical protein
VRGVIGWLSAFLLGCPGWWLGGKAGFSAAVMLSVVASGAGLWLGYRWRDEYLA